MPNYRELCRNSQRNRRDWLSEKIASAKDMNWHNHAKFRHVQGKILDGRPHFLAIFFIACCRFECCFQNFDIRPGTEKPSAGMFFVLSSSAFRGRGVQPGAWRHVRIFRENVWRPWSLPVRCKNPGRRQYHAQLQGGASRSSLKSCSKPGDGFLPRNCRDRTGFQFGFPSICFSLPGFLDFGV